MSKEQGVCIHCDGTGEGLYDGSSCDYCGGSGFSDSYEEDEDYDNYDDFEIPEEPLECHQYYDGT